MPNLVIITEEVAARMQLPDAALRADLLAQRDLIDARLCELDGEYGGARLRRQFADGHLERRDAILRSHLRCNPAAIDQRVTRPVNPFSNGLAASTRAWIDNLSAHRRDSALVPSCGTSETDGDAA